MDGQWCVNYLCCNWCDTCSVYCSFSKSSALTFSLFPSTSSTSDCNLYTEQNTITIITTGNSDEVTLLLTKEKVLSPERDYHWVGTAAWQLCNSVRINPTARDHITSNKWTLEGRGSPSLCVCVCVCVHVCVCMYVCVRVVSSCKSHKIYINSTLHCLSIVYPNPNPNLI